MATTQVPCKLPFEMTTGGVLHMLSFPMLIFGAVTNALCIAVFLKKMTKSPTVICLLLLSICDMIHCICFLPYAMNFYRYTGTFSYMYQNASPFIKFGTQPIIHLMRAYSIYIIALLSVERLVAFAAPSKMAKWFNRQQVILYNVVLFLFAVCIIAPKVTLDVPVDKYSSCVDGIVHATMTRPGFEWFTSFYYGPFQGVMITLLPLAVIIPCNIALVYMLCSKRHSTNSSFDASDRQLIRFIFVLVGVSTFLFTTSSILPTIAMYAVVSRDVYLSLVVGKHFVNVCMASINVLLYFALPSFRHALVTLCVSENQVEGDATAAYSLKNATENKNADESKNTSENEKAAEEVEATEIGKEDTTNVESANETEAVTGAPKADDDNVAGW